MDPLLRKMDTGSKSMRSHDFTYVKIKQKYFRLLEMYPITSKEYPFEAYTGISKLTTTKVCVINIDRLC